MSGRRIFVFSEDLARPYDEGIKKAAVQVIRALTERMSVLTACRFGDATLGNVMKIPGLNRLLLGLRLRHLIRGFAPDTILYVPQWAGTYASFLRMKVLGSYCPAAKSLLLVLQPKFLSRLQRRSLGFLRPDRVLTSSPRVMKEMSELGIPASFFPPYTDLGKFVPLPDAAVRGQLRQRYGIPPEKYIILHVGHINSGRNLEALVPLQTGDQQVLLVSSSSTSRVAFKEEPLKRRLMGRGIMILDDYLEKIEEAYQLADVYVFPVVRETGCIGLPLSVLEARACGLPVLSSDFGGLRTLFRRDDLWMTYADPGDFPAAVGKIRKSKAAGSGRDEIERVNRLFTQAIAGIAEG